jgi:hypothetical protein
MLLGELNVTRDEIGLIKLRQRFDQMVVMHNEVADIFGGVFGKKFFTGGCVEILSSTFASSSIATSASSSRWPPLRTALNLSDTCRLVKYPSSIQADTSNLTAGCTAHVF